QAVDHPDFADATHQHLSQMDPGEFQAGAQQAAMQAPPQQRQQVASDLLGALQAKGLNLSSIASMLGLGSASPQQMGPQGLAQLLGWAQQNHPEAASQAVSNSPGFLQQMGGPVVSGILQNLAGRFLG